MGVWVGSVYEATCTTKVAPKYPRREVRKGTSLSMKTVSPKSRKREIRVS